MNTWEMEDRLQDLIDADDRDDCLIAAIWDAYFESLRKFYALNRKTEKEWEELNWYEVEQVKRDYAWNEQQEERITDPENFYGTAGTR